MTNSSLTPIVATNMLEVSRVYAQTGAEWLQNGGTLWGQILIFLTTVAGFLYNMYRERRNREWDLEDRAAARSEAALKLELAAQKTETVALAAKQEIVSKIDENTFVNTKQIEVSNEFNKKLEVLQQSFLDVKTEAIQTAAETAARIAAAERETRRQGWKQRKEYQQSVSSSLAKTEQTLERVEDNTETAVELLRQKDGDGKDAP